MGKTESDIKEEGRALGKTNNRVDGRDKREWMRQRKESMASRESARS